MKKILILALAFACGLTVWAQDAAAPAANAQEAAAPAADAAAVPDQAPQLETSDTGNQLSALDFVLGIGYNYRKFHAAKQYSKANGGYAGGGCGPDPHEQEKVYIGNTEFGSSECFGYELNFLLPF